MCRPHALPSLAITHICLQLLNMLHGLGHLLQRLGLPPKHVQPLGKLNIDALEGAQLPVSILQLLPGFIACGGGFGGLGEEWQRASSCQRA